MKKLFASLLLVGLVFVFANGVGAHEENHQTTPTNGQTITGSHGTITNKITVGSYTGSNEVKLGGSIWTKNATTKVELQNVLNANSLAGQLSGNQSISSSWGRITNTVNADASSGSNKIGGNGCCWWYSCNGCNNYIGTGNTSLGVSLTNAINVNEKTTGNTGTQTIQDSKGTIGNTVNGWSSTGSNVIYLGGSIGTGSAVAKVGVVNVINQNLVSVPQP